MKTILSILMLAVFASTVAYASEIPAPAQDHPIALVGGTIHPVSGAVIDDGTILFEKGKITAIGTSVTLPPGTETIDIRGRHVYPGMIDARSVIGLTEIGAIRATNDISEVGNVDPNIRSEVAVNPESEIIPVTRANGVTTAAIVASGGTISGTAAVINLDGWTWEEMTISSTAGLIINWPQMTISHAWWERRSEDEQKQARDKALAELRNAFRDARAYWKAKQAESQKDVPYHPVDMRWEAMVPVLEGKMPVIVNADEIQQIEAAVAWAQQEHLKLVIAGGYDAWRVTDLLKANDVSVIVNPMERVPWRDWEAYDDPCTIPKKLLDAGVKFCIAAENGASNERNLPYHAARAASFGLPKEEALKSVTLYPASILGIADRMGSLESGKDATLIVTTGDPLEITTNVEQEFIEGKKIPLQSRHTHLYEKYKEKYRRLSTQAASK